MILLEKWSELPVNYTIMFPISHRISVADFFGLIDCGYTDTEIDDIIDCGTSEDEYTDIIDCGTSEDGDKSVPLAAKLVLVNSVNYHSYEYPVTPIKATLTYVKFNLELTQNIETGDYQAFFLVNDKILDTNKLKIKEKFNNYSVYEPNRDIKYNQL